MNTHAIKRTSPKGQDFMGRCIYCGSTELKAMAAKEPCPKAPGHSQQVLDMIILDRTRAGGTDE